MIDVHHEIADLQIAEVREKGLRQTPALLSWTTLLFEDVRLGVDLKSRGREPESARQGADRHEYGGGTWNHPLIDSSDKATVTALDAIGKDRFVVGTPDQCIEKIKLFQQATGADHFICRLFFPGMPHEHIMEELRLLANEVIPAFKD